MGYSQGIYKITNLQNRCIYIGLSKHIEHRLEEHISNSSNTRLKKDIKIYGINNFEFTILETINDIEKLNERETHWINFFKQNNFSLYNVKKNSENENLKRQTYYLGEDIIKALGVKSVIEGIDKSKIVREALEKHIESAYFCKK